MTEEMFGLGDPVIRRLQQAFAHEEPATELAAIMQRAAQYQAWEPPESDDAPVSHHDLTVADLVAARHREPAAVTRIYTAYAPALSRYFLAAVGDHRLAEDLTGTAFVRPLRPCPAFAARSRRSAAGCSRSPATTCTTTAAGGPARGSSR